MIHISEQVNNLSLVPGADEDDVVINAFKTFDENGKIDGER